MPFSVVLDTCVLYPAHLRDTLLRLAEPSAIEIIHPDTFLLDLLDLAPGVVIADLSQQAAANRRAPRTLSEILDALV